MEADTRTKAAVLEALDEFFMAYAKRDVRRTVACFTPDPDLVFIGTWEDETLLGPTMVETKLRTRDFARNDEVSLTYGWNSVSSSGPVAWAAAEVTFHRPGEEETGRSPNHRLTGVFENRGDKWLIAQLHVSWPSDVTDE